MKRFVIERVIPQVGNLNVEQLQQAAQKSCAVLRDLGTGIQWEHSYRAQDQLFCVYLAEDESLIRQHAEMSGFPATRITEINTVIDPTTENRAA